MKTNISLTFGILIFAQSCLFFDSGESNNLASKNNTTETTPSNNGELNNGTTNNETTKTSICGDGNITGKEVCDDGPVSASCAAMGQVVCSNDCKSFDFSDCYQYSKVSAGGITVVKSHQQKK